MSNQTRDWETKSLEAIAGRIDYGHTASADEAEVGPKFLRITDIQNGHVDWDSVPYCQASTEEIDQYRLCRGDIVFARTGATTGKSFLIEDCPEDSVFASYLIRVRPGPSIEPRFLARFFDTPNYWGQIRKHAKGAGQPGVNATSLKSIEVPLPPLPEQKRIADILDKADAIRRKRREATAYLDEMVLSLFENIVGDPLVNPHGWRMTTLGDHVDFVTGFAFQSSRYTDNNGVRLLRGANVFPGHVEWSDTCYWPVDDVVDDRFHLSCSDVVLAMDRPWISSGIKVARVSESDLPSYLVQRVARLRSISKVSQAFIYYSLRHPAFTTHCGNRKTETTVPHISPHDIRSFPIPDLPENVHERFASAVDSLGRTTHHMRCAEQQSLALFNSLVQRAFRREL